MAKHSNETFTTDMHSPFGNFIFSTAKASNVPVLKFRTRGLFAMKVSSMYITSHMSFGSDVPRLTLEISGTVDSITGVFADQRRTLTFSDVDKPPVSMTYALSNEETKNLIDNGMYDRDDYASLFSNLMSDGTIMFETDLEYASVQPDFDAQPIVITDCGSFTSLSLTESQAVIPFQEAFDVINELTQREAYIPKEELEVIDDKGVEHQSIFIAEENTAEEEVIPETEFIEEEPMFGDILSLDDSELSAKDVVRAMTDDPDLEDNPEDDVDIEFDDELYDDFDEEFGEEFDEEVFDENDLDYGGSQPNNGLESVSDVDYDEEHREAMIKELTEGLSRMSGGQSQGAEAELPGVDEELGV